MTIYKTEEMMKMEQMWPLGVPDQNLTLIPSP